MSYVFETASQQASPRALPAAGGYDFDLDHDLAPRYWPTELLSTFTLLMAANGCCVIASMMLGDRDYALRQLVRAHTLSDDALRAVAVKLFDFFDDPADASHAEVVGH